MLVCLWGFSDGSYVCTIYPYFPLKCSHSIINSSRLYNMHLILFSPFSHKQYFNNEIYLYYFCWMPCIVTLIIVGLSMLFIIHPYFSLDIMLSIISLMNGLLVHDISFTDNLSLFFPKFELLVVTLSCIFAFHFIRY